MGMQQEEEEDFGGGNPLMTRDAAQARIIRGEPIVHRGEPITTGPHARPLGIGAKYDHRRILLAQSGWGRAAPTSAESLSEAPSAAPLTAQQSSVIFGEPTSAERAKEELTRAMAAEEAKEEAQTKQWKKNKNYYAKKTAEAEAKKAAEERANKLEEAMARREAEQASAAAEEARQEELEAEAKLLAIKQAGVRSAQEVARAESGAVAVQEVARAESGAVAVQDGEQPKKFGKKGEAKAKQKAAKAKRVAEAARKKPAAQEEGGYGGALAMALAMADDAAEMEESPRESGGEEERTDENKSGAPEDGWQLVEDEEHGTYYYNGRTGLTQWEDPRQDGVAADCAEGGNSGGAEGTRAARGASATVNSGRINADVESGRINTQRHWSYEGMQSLGGAVPVVQPHHHAEIMRAVHHSRGQPSARPPSHHDRV
jgi:hypothetical protein